MSYVLDTCVLSDARRRDAPEALVAWLRHVPEFELYLPVIVLGEIQQGIVALPHGQRRRELQGWFEADLIARFAGRILDVDLRTALAWGRLRGEVTGGPAPVVDALIAATAIRHDFSLVTRNERDFGRFPVRVVNPWGDD